MAKEEQDKDPIEQLELKTLVGEIIDMYVLAESIVDCDEMLTLGELRLRLGAVPMFGSQQSDPLVSLIRMLEAQGYIMRNVPGSGPCLLLKMKYHYPTPAEMAINGGGGCL